MTPSFRLVSKRVRRGSRQEAALRALCRKNLSGSATNGGTYIDAGPAYASGFSNRQGEIGPLRVLTLHEDRSGRARTQSSPTVVGLGPTLPTLGMTAGGPYNARMAKDTHPGLHIPPTRREALEDRKLLDR